MDMVTVKRDGVFISFSEFERKNGDVRDDVILGARVNKSINSCKRRNVPSKKKTAQKPKSVIKSKYRKAMHEMWKSMHR